MKQQVFNVEQTKTTSNERKHHDVLIAWHWIFTFSAQSIEGQWCEDEISILNISRQEAREGNKFSSLLIWQQQSELDAFYRWLYWVGSH